MKKIVCEMCECTEFAKVDGMFVCQECGCKYTVADARKLMVEMADEPDMPAEPAVQEEPEEVFPPHTPESPNRIAVTITKVGHETYTMESVMSLSAFLGEPSPVFVDGPDEVGHVGIALRIENLAGKTIKYIVVYVTPYNRVGDPVECSVEGHSNFGTRTTGPIEAGEIWEGTCDGIWYNHSIVGAKITHADVEFMDGTKERFDAAALTQQEKASSTNVPLTVVFHGCASGAQALWYSIDGGSRMTLNSGDQHLSYLKPGHHVFKIMNPFMKKEYSFQLQSHAKAIVVQGKPLGFAFSEK